MFFAVHLDPGTLAYPVARSSFLEAPGFERGEVPPKTRCPIKYGTIELQYGWHVFCHVRQILTADYWYDYYE